jgi:DNA-binding NarL/FixJ family response regulator
MQADPPRGVTVLIADPSPTSRAELSAVLVRSGVGNIIEADTVVAVRDLIADGSGGDLALVSLGFGDVSTRLIQDLRNAPWQRVIALAPTADPTPLLAAVQAGACGVLRGRPGPANEIPSQVHRLTAREIEVLRLVADGRTNKWIATQLSLSALTVKSHLARISRKLGTGDRSHLVAIAMRAGSIS